MPKNGISAMAEMTGRAAAKEFLDGYRAEFGDPSAHPQGFEIALAGFMASAIQDVMDAKREAGLAP